MLGLLRAIIFLNGIILLVISLLVRYVSRNKKSVTSFEQQKYAKDSHRQVRFPWLDPALESHVIREKCVTVSDASRERKQNKKKKKQTTIYIYIHHCQIFMTAWKVWKETMEEKSRWGVRIS